MGYKVSPQASFTGHIVPEQEHVVPSRQGHPRLWEHIQESLLISGYSEQAAAAPVRLKTTSL